MIVEVFSEYDTESVVAKSERVPDEDQCTTFTPLTTVTKQEADVNEQGDDVENLDDVDTEDGDEHGDDEGDVYEETDDEAEEEEGKQSQPVTDKPPTKPEVMNLCPVCGESVERNRFYSHMKRHNPEVSKNYDTKDGPFPCEMCDKVCGTRSALSTHRRRHFPHLQLVCEICAKVSTTNAIHKNHMLVS